MQASNTNLKLQTGGLTCNNMGDKLLLNFGAKLQR